MVAKMMTVNLHKLIFVEQTSEFHDKKEHIKVSNKNMKWQTLGQKKQKILMYGNNGWHHSE